MGVKALSNNNIRSRYCEVTSRSSILQQEKKYFSNYSEFVSHPSRSYCHYVQNSTRVYTLKTLDIASTEHLSLSKQFATFKFHYISHIFKRIIFTTVKCQNSTCDGICVVSALQVPMAAMMVLLLKGKK
jgi:hypothetical protein